MRKIYTLAELTHHLNGELHGDAMHSIQAVASLGCAGSNELAYFDNPALIGLLTNTKAGAVLLTANHVEFCPVNSLVVTNPLASMATVAEMLNQPAVQTGGIHSQASVAPSATLGRQVAVGINTIIGEGVCLGDKVTIAENCVIDAGVIIGDQTVIASGACIQKGSRIGNKVMIGSGAVVGAPPFNSEKIQGQWHAGWALGGVFIENNVRIGANTVISKGALGDTVISEGVHIDDLVQIAHEVIIGAHTAIASCATLGAYARIGSHCIIGGASCVTAHVTLADDVVITAMSTVNKSIARAGIYSSGTAISEHQRWRRNVARFRRLDDYIMRIIRLEREKQVNQ
ncbi:UDP-3-O-(3-hydroxymyristoyl)glucosamine N-acyltransferase [Legionella fairfieldensis]|uniref:UDP-3-O-(3-hydroxymyristoyl)glucosamine N-acyltransferase n=1 Tax=Legionella fairfieldensis TaxID=45064 RepID=UPI001040E82A|nr:UDP-3-O-(3-hydroxymyristoyl)glucosamine N-acyltransferase [Legionella fairfieldensis]